MIVVGDFGLHVAYLLANENIVAHRHIAAFQLSDKIRETMLVGIDVHTELIVHFLVVLHHELHRLLLTD